MTELTPDYLLVGHLAHDITPSGPQLGGTVAYAAYTAVAFGLRVGILTSTQPDEPLMRRLPDGVMVTSVPAEFTTTFENLYINGSRTQYLHHRAATLHPEALPPAWRQARLIHLAPVANEVDPAFVFAFGSNPICVTPQGWMRQQGPDKRVFFIPWKSADQVLPRARLVVLSEEDIQHDPGLETVFANLAPILVVTRAERGGTVYQGRQRHEFPARQIEQVEPTGAGDIFATALHITLDRLNDLDRAVQVAAWLAGQSVSRVGFAGAPTPQEVVQTLNTYS
jgi:sugar/nucleoside kinase (ribokinase family)